MESKACQEGHRWGVLINWNPWTSERGTINDTKRDDISCNYPRQTGTSVYPTYRVDNLYVTQRVINKKPQRSFSLGSDVVKTCVGKAEDWTVSKERRSVETKLGLF